MKQIKRRREGKAFAKTPILLGMIAFGFTAVAVVLSLQVHAQAPGSSKVASMQTATGQYITPTALRGAVQQFLKPGLALYPNFVAGEAVRSQLSPDGKTLAILCAGQNSLDSTTGTVSTTLGRTDVANSTQYIFLYDV